MASNTQLLELQLKQEAAEKSRSVLQSYMKSHGLPATGSTAVLRQAYLLARRSEYCLVAPKSTAAASSVTAAAPKISAKKKAPPASARKPEKRLKRYRTSCAAPVRQRIARAKSQRLYLVEAPKCTSTDKHHYDFVIMGSTGNLYTVRIGNLVHCTCPDHAKGNVCKHILFVLLKVVGLNQESPLLYQTALLNSELEEIFSQLQTRISTVGRRGDVMANASVQQAYQELTSPDSKKAATKKEEEEEESGVKRQPIEGDCPICFDPLASETLVYCKAMCGANFHSTCMANWKRNQQSNNVTCPNCRTHWQEENSMKAAGAASPEGFANLGRLQGQTPERDTSTYSEWYGYNRGSRGQRRSRW